MSRAAVIGLLFTLSMSAFADIAAPPIPATYTSSQGLYRLTIYPNVEAARSNSGQEPDPTKARALMLEALRARCRAVVEKFDGNAYSKIREVPLANSVGPQDAIVSDSSGAFATFGDWIGPSPSVTIYNHNGTAVHTYQLHELVSKVEFEGIDLWRWRDVPKTSIEASTDVLSLPIFIHPKASTASAAPELKWVQIRLLDGKLVE